MINEISRVRITLFCDKLVCLERTEALGNFKNLMRVKISEAPLSVKVRY